MELSLFPKHSLSRLYLYLFFIYSTYISCPVHNKKQLRYNCFMITDDSILV